MMNIEGKVPCVVELCLWILHGELTCSRCAPRAPLGAMVPCCFVGSLVLLQTIPPCNGGYFRARDQGAAILVLISPAKRLQAESTATNENLKTSLRYP